MKVPAGNPNDEIIRRFGYLVTRAARNVSSNKDACEEREDLISIGNIILIEKRGEIMNARRPEALAYQMVRREMLDAKRRGFGLRRNEEAYHKTRNEKNALWNDIDDLISNISDKQVVQDLINRCSEESRECVLWFLNFDGNYMRIATYLRISPTTARNKVRKGFREIRESIEKEKNLNMLRESII